MSRNGNASRTNDNSNAGRAGVHRVNPGKRKTASSNPVRTTKGGCNFVRPLRAWIEFTRNGSWKGSHKLRSFFRWQKVIEMARARTVAANWPVLLTLRSIPSLCMLAQSCRPLTAKGSVPSAVLSFHGKARNALTVGGPSRRHRQSKSVADCVEVWTSRQFRWGKHNRARRKFRKLRFVEFAASRCERPGGTSTDAQNHRTRGR